MDDLAFAKLLADQADAISLPAFVAANHVVRTKPDQSPVTQTDLAVEAAIRAAITARHPRDSILGEEQGFAAGSGASGRRWIIDPIDGTKNFMAGVPLYGTLIALEVNGVLEVAVVSMPALGCGTRYWAQRGGGAWKQAGADPPRRLRVSGVGRIEDGLVGLSGVEGVPAAAERRFDRLRSRFFLDRKVGNTWMQMLVAEGVAACAIGGHLAVWDLAAPRLIIEEAGGRMTNWAGDPQLQAGTAVSSNGVLHDELVRALRPAWIDRARAIWPFMRLSGPRWGAGPAPGIG